MESSSEIQLETMCICVPLRLGVFFMAILTFVTSLLYALDREFWETAFRHNAGGYALWSRVSVTLVQCTGILFGPVGAFGAYYCKRSYVANFNLWQFARLFAWLFMYYVDVPLLMECEHWVNDIQDMTKKHGWNDTLYHLALSANCSSERMHFFVKSGFTFLIFAYIVWCTSKYQVYMGRIPKHLLRVPKELAPAAFHSYSLGERSALTGNYGKGPDVNQPGMGFVPPGNMGFPATGGSIVGPAVRTGPF